MKGKFYLFFVCLGFLIFNSMLCGACVESERFAMAAFYAIAMLIQVLCICGTLGRDLQI